MCTSGVCIAFTSFLIPPPPHTHTHTPTPTHTVRYMAMAMEAETKPSTIYVGKVEPSPMMERPESCDNHDVKIEVNGTFVNIIILP